MSCCGNKRNAWLQKERQTTVQNNNTDIPDGRIKRKNDTVFIYTGNGSLTINGVFTGKVYKYNYKGHKLKVAYSDSFAMMAEKYLKRIKGEKLGN